MPAILAMHRVRWWVPAAGQKIFLDHGLRHSRVNAGTAQVQELFGLEDVGGMNHGGMDHHVVVDEFSGAGGVSPIPPTVPATRKTYSGRLP